MSHSLRFRPDGTFKIAQFTDTHIHNGEPKDQQTQALISQVLDAEQPDLVVLTGDVISGKGVRDPAAAWRFAVEPIVERGILWASVFGNHDDESGLSRQALMDVQQSIPCCLSEPGPQDVSGVGNYVLCIQSATGEKPAAMLYFLDSNGYAETDVEGYGWIRSDQIEWYRNTARDLRRFGGENPLPALAFFHIPLPEYNEVWNEHPCQGIKQENVCCPRINTGFFAAMHLAGDLIGTFVGHDHVNDYQGDLYGIRLCYGRGSGFNTYGREGFLHGARVIRLREGRREFGTWLRLEDGTCEKQHL